MSLVAEGRSPVSRLLGVLDIDLRTLALVLVLIASWLVFDLWTGGLFLTPRNLYNLAVQSSVVAILATGMVLVIVSRHIDLSVGSVLGFVGMVIALLQIEVFPREAWWNWPLTIVVGLALGALIGLWHGVWIAYLGVPSFVVTLGGLLIFRGAAFEVAQGRTLAPLHPTYQLLGGGAQGSIGPFWSWCFAGVAITILGFLIWHARVQRRRYANLRTPVLIDALRFVVIAAVLMAFVATLNAYPVPQSTVGRGIPVPVLILVAAVVLMEFAARETRFGRYVYAIGGGKEAAELAGIKVKRTVVAVFVLTGVLAGIAAVITTARLNAGTNSLGSLLELNVIAAAVIGGASLSGGRGSVSGAILGAVVIQSLETGLVLVGSTSSARMIVIGLVLMLAARFDRMLTRRDGDAA